MVSQTCAAQSSITSNLGQPRKKLSVRLTAMKKSWKPLHGKEEEKGGEGRRREEKASTKNCNAMVWHIQRCKEVTECNSGCMSRTVEYSTQQSQHKSESLPACISCAQQVQPVLHINSAEAE